MQRHFIAALLAARLSSAEEGKFGIFLENLAIFVAESTRRGQKSGIEGIDIELPHGGVRYLIAVKSGKNWGNSTSTSKQKDNFRRAVRVIKQSARAGEVQPVLGICYGKFRTNHTGDYIHIGGQSFWHLLSGDKQLYVDIVEPLGCEAQRYDDKFKERVASLSNKLTLEFTEQYCHRTGAIDWKALVESVSRNMD